MGLQLYQLCWLRHIAPVFSLRSPRYEIGYSLKTRRRLVFSVPAVV